MRTKVLVIAALLALAGILQTGCAPQQQIVDGYRIEGPVPANDGSERPITRLLFYSRALIQASPTGRLALLESAKTAYAQNPSPATAARLALAYGQPNYKGYAPENGWRYANTALTSGNDYWRPAAVAYLRQFSALCADNDHVRGQLEAASQQTETTRQQLVQAWQALSRAQRKLHALTQIETQLKP